MGSSLLGGMGNRVLLLLGQKESHNSNTFWGFGKLYIWRNLLELLPKIIEKSFNRLNRVPYWQTQICNIAFPNILCRVDKSDHFSISVANVSSLTGLYPRWSWRKWCRTLGNVSLKKRWNDSNVDNDLLELIFKIMASPHIQILFCGCTMCTVH